MAPRVVADQVAHPGLAADQLRPGRRVLPDVEERRGHALGVQHRQDLRRARARAVVEGQRDGLARARRVVVRAVRRPGQSAEACGEVIRGGAATRPLGRRAGGPGGPSCPGTGGGDATTAAAAGPPAAGNAIVSPATTLKAVNVGRERDLELRMVISADSSATRAHQPPGRATLNRTGRSTGNRQGRMMRPARPKVTALEQGDDGHGRRVLYSSLSAGPGVRPPLSVRGGGSGSGLHTRISDFSHQPDGSAH